MHLSRQWNLWSLRCSWSIACRRCSNYIFILNLTPGFNGLGNDNCKTGRETFMFWDWVRLILENWRYVWWQPHLYIGNFYTGKTESLYWGVVPGTIGMSSGGHCWNYYPGTFSFLSCHCNSCRSGTIIKINGYLSCSDFNIWVGTSLVTPVKATRLTHLPLVPHICVSELAHCQLDP